METQREVAKQPTTFLVPPVRLEFSIEQTQKSYVVAHIRAFSGNHCFLHRWLKTELDPCDAMPVTVLNHLLQWTLWLEAFERERRLQRSAHSRIGSIRWPDTPAVPLSEIALDHHDADTPPF